MYVAARAHYSLSECISRLHNRCTGDVNREQCHHDGYAVDTRMPCIYAIMRFYARVSFTINLFCDYCSEP